MKNNKEQTYVLEFFKSFSEFLENIIEENKATLTENELKLAGLKTQREFKYTSKMNIANSKKTEDFMLYIL